MRKKFLFVFFIVILLLAVSLCVFSCQRANIRSSSTRNAPVIASMKAVRDGLIAADGSKGQNVFNMSAGGTAKLGGKDYTFTLEGNFNISETNRVSDKLSQFLFEVKEGNNETLAAYYSQGKLYLHYPPYVSQGVAYDVNLAQTLYNVYSAKETGMFKSVLDILPDIAGYIFSSCTKSRTLDSTTYTFTLSYTQLFDSLHSLLDGLNLGITGDDITAALHVTDADIRAFATSQPETKLIFTVAREGGVTAAAYSKKTTDDFTGIDLESFALVQGSRDLTLPSSLGVFTDFSAGNISLGGSLVVKTNNVTDYEKSFNYDISSAASFSGDSYPFTYILKRNVASDGKHTLSLNLVDMYDRTFSLYVDGDAVYADLTDFSIGKIKTTLTAIRTKLGNAGFYHKEELSFEENVRMLTLLLAARETDGTKISYSISGALSSLINKKIGFFGIFGLDEFKLSWDTANSRITNVTANMQCGVVSAALTADSFAFGDPVVIAAPTDLDGYVDIDAVSTIRMKASGLIREQTEFSSDGEALGAFLSSISGEEISFEGGITAGLKYNADIVFAQSGALDACRVEFFTPAGAGVVTLYYVSETADKLYLIYPVKSGVSSIKTLNILEEPFAAFNAAVGLTKAALEKRMYPSATATTVTFGGNYGLACWLSEKITAMYEGFDISDILTINFSKFYIGAIAPVANGDAYINGFSGNFRLDSENNFLITGTSFEVAFDENIKVASYQANIPEKVTLLANDTVMPAYADLTFEDGSNRRVSLYNEDLSSKVWKYPNAPQTVVQGQERTVTAVADVLGYTISRDITVDISTASDVDLFAITDKYDYSTKTFIFDLYGQENPKEVIPFEKQMDVTVGGISYRKSIEWDLSGVSTSVAAVDGKRTFTISPKIPTFFGDLIKIGDVADFTLVINGEKAASTNYEMTFVAYDGKDPTNEAVYSDVIVIKTIDGEDVQVSGVKWDLQNNTVRNHYENGTLYEYEGAITVKAKVYDCLGAYVTINVNSYFVPRKVDTVTFNALADGVTYIAPDSENPDAYAGFEFDVIKVRGLDPTKTGTVLPTSFIANAGTANEFVINAANWEFTAVSGVQNASGQSGTLTLVIGDDISGYQRNEFAYRFTKANIVSTALLDANGTEISSKVLETLDAGESLFQYDFEHLNSYTYKYPAKVKVGLLEESPSADGEGDSDPVPPVITYITIDAAWAFNKTFDKNTLYAGGDYVGVFSVGSDIFTINMQFDQMYITGYKFAATNAVKGGDVQYGDYKGVDCLIYDMLDAVSSSGPDYADVECYPSTISIQFNGEAEWYESTISAWDISAVTSKTGMISTGFFNKVSATVGGQRINIDLCVNAITSDANTVYVDAEKNTVLSFHLLGEKDGKLVITDPCSVESYPDKLYFYNSAHADPIPVTVSKWELGDSLKLLYSTGFAAGKKSNEINSAGQTITVNAIIGGENIGSTIVKVEVAVVESVIADIAVSGIPYASGAGITGGSNPYAIEVDYTEGTSGPFNYSFSISINPYYVTPTDGRAYPKNVDFTVDGHHVTVPTVWDLTRISANAVEEGNNYTYKGYTGTYGFPIYATVEIGDNYQSIFIPVELNVKKRHIDKVWLNGSSQPYIDLNGYDTEPFGGNVSGDMVTMDAEVQFEGDGFKYPLKLKYSKKDIVLSYDGSNVYENIDVYVGNENGGYQKITGYTVRVMSNIVSEIKLLDSDKADGTDGIFYKATVDASGKVTYICGNVVDNGKEPPELLKIRFGGGELQDVPRYNSNATQEGPVFEWVRNAKNEAGIRVWNASLPANVRGAYQDIYNENQTSYNALTVGTVFMSGDWSIIYRDMEDGGYWTTDSVVAEFAQQIKVDRVAADSQERYISDNNGNRITSNKLSAGTYRYYINVEHHNIYQGTVYKEFTISSKALALDKVKLYVNNAEMRASYVYTGNDYTVKAATANYAEDVTLYVNGLPTQKVRNVNYTAENWKYSFNVTSGDSNYTFSNVYEFVITEAVGDAMKAVASVNWDAGSKKFKVKSVKYDGDLIYADNDGELDDGYRATYYDAEGRVEVSTFESGVTYQCFVEIKMPNYGKIETLTEIIAG